MFNDPIKEAQRLLAATNDKAHDIHHAFRVAQNALLIGKKVGYTNLDLLEVCGWWHDVGRLKQDEGHEKVSAELLFTVLKEHGLNRSICESAYLAVVYHKWNMKPQTLEGDIIRDADKLDFISLERWQSCLENNQLKHLRDIKALLDQLPEILTLKESKMIYAKRLYAFKTSGLENFV